MGCRDCKQCAQSPIGKLIGFCARLMYLFCLSWNIGLFLKGCPQCKHLMRWHQRDEAGRFKD